jgi:hypothetical protein
MSALSLRLPNSLHDRARDLARREGISINQLVAAALAEKMSALLTQEYLEARVVRGSRQKFLSALARVPAAEPDARDALPATTPGARRASPKRRTRTGGRPSRKRA